jgi:membrane protease YdiL (CAAX protease family)
LIYHSQPPFPAAGFFSKVKQFLKSEAGAVVLWVTGALLLAATLSPWIYQGGKALAEAAAARELAGIWEWLGAACGRAKFSRFFSRSLALSALVLLPFLFRRVRKLRASGKPAATSAGTGWKSALLQIAIGCLIAGGILWAVCMILQAVGAYSPAPNPPALGKLLSKSSIPAVAAPLVEEPLFRGLLLGLWLRSAKPLTACLGTSLIFAFLHFLEPPAGMSIANPASAFAGFELLGKLLFHFTDPRFFVTDFATLFGVGMILAMARVRTGALWFSIGLHAGWVVAFKACNLLLKPVSDHPLRPWGVGENLRSGLLPLLALIITAVICHFVLRYFQRPLPTVSPASP